MFSDPFLLFSGSTLHQLLLEPKLLPVSQHHLRKTVALSDLAEEARGSTLDILIKNFGELLSPITPNDGVQPIPRWERPADRDEGGLTFCCFTFGDTSNRADDRHCRADALPSFLPRYRLIA